MNKPMVHKLTVLMSIRPLIQNLLLTAFLLFLQGAILACPCEKASFQQEIKQTDVVFKGKILKKEANILLQIGNRLPFEELVHLVSVLRTYKGRLYADTVVLITDKVYPGNCAKNLEVGGTYLLYTRYEENVYFYSESGCRLFTDWCTRTTRFAWADQQELQLLEKIDRPKDFTTAVQRSSVTQNMLWIVLTNVLIVLWVIYLRKRKTKTV